MISSDSFKQFASTEEGMVLPKVGISSYRFSVRRRSEGKNECVVSRDGKEYSLSERALDRLTKLVPIGKRLISECPEDIGSDIEYFLAKEYEGLGMLADGDTCIDFYTRSYFSYSNLIGYGNVRVDYSNFDVRSPKSRWASMFILNPNKIEVVKGEVKDVYLPGVYVRGSSCDPSFRVSVGIIREICSNGMIDDSSRHSNLMFVSPEDISSIASLWSSKEYVDRVTGHISRSMDIPFSESILSRGRFPGKVVDHVKRVVLGAGTEFAKVVTKSAGIPTFGSLPGGFSVHDVFSLITDYAKSVGRSRVTYMRRAFSWICSLN